MGVGLMAVSLSPSASTTNNKSKSQCVISHSAAGEMYAIDIIGARANFERRFMEKGGVPFDPDRCFFVWKGLPCTERCASRELIDASPAHGSN